MTSNSGHLEDYSFTSTSPDQRPKLAQLAHAYSSALAQGDRELAERVKDEALRLKLGLPAIQPVNH